MEKCKCFGWQTKRSISGCHENVSLSELDWAFLFSFSLKKRGWLEASQRPSANLQHPGRIEGEMVLYLITQMIHYCWLEAEPHKRCPSLLTPCLKTKAGVTQPPGSLSQELYVKKTSTGNLFCLAWDHWSGSRQSLTIDHRWSWPCPCLEPTG